MLIEIFQNSKDFTDSALLLIDVLKIVRTLLETKF